MPSNVLPLNAIVFRAFFPLPCGNGLLASSVKAQEQDSQSPPVNI